MAIGTYRVAIDATWIREHASEWLAEHDRAVKAEALQEAMSIYEQICGDGGEISHEEDNYAVGWAHGAYAFNEAIRSRLPHTAEYREDDAK